MAINWDNVEFKGEKRYLSNMYPCKIKFDSKYKNEYPEFDFDNKIYNSSEHLYQALKSKNRNWHKLIRDTIEPKETKKLARKKLSKYYKENNSNNIFKIREDWEEIKLKAMEITIFLKFTQNQELLEKLLKEDTYIEERNDWNDIFWGTYKGIGKNYLGKLLMKLRDKIKLSP